MTKYINAGWLYGTLCNLWDKTDSEDFEKGVFETIINAPTADVVEVVRCKDCRHAGECHKSVQYTRNEPNSVTIGYSQIEWCSRGERKEESEVKE